MAPVISPTEVHESHGGRAHRSNQQKGAMQKRQRLWPLSSKLGLFIHPHLDVSENSGTPKSSILIGVSIINHAIWGTPIFGNHHLGEPWWY